MSAPAEPHDGATAALLAVLDLADSDARTTEDIFTGVSHFMPTGRVYGGQVLAQSVVAAQRTVAEDRIVHSMHGYFLRPGDSRLGITYAVDRIHDGRSFARRRTQAFQHGTPIFSMIASFQDEETGLDHQSPFPADLPAPEALLAVDPEIAGADSVRLELSEDRPLELRHIPSAIYDTVEEGETPGQAVWMRTRRRLPDVPWMHRATLAYMSDLTIQEPVLRAHGLPWSTPGLKIASLDHAMWWHRYARVDDWLLYVQESPNARGGRGLSLGRMFSRDGALIATVAQEITVRVPDPV